MAKVKSSQTVSEKIKSSFLVYGPKGIHSLSVNDSYQPSKKALADSQRIHANTVLMAVDHPKVYSYNLGGDRIDNEGVAKLLLNPETRKSVTEIIQNGTILREAIELISGAKAGVFSTDTDSISFEIVRSRLFECIPSCTNEVAYVIANLFTPFRTIMGLSAPSYLLQTLRAEVVTYPDRADVVEELEYRQLITALSEIDFSFLKKEKKKMGVGDIATKYERALYPLVMKFELLASISRAYDTVLALVKGYLLKQFDQYDPEELSIFQEERFLALATNLSIVDHALSESAKFRPLIGANFWMQAIERIGLNLASSQKYKHVEVKAIREHYTLSSVTDLRGFKKGFLISRNLREMSKLQVFRTTRIGGEYNKLYEDKTAESVLSGLFSTLSSITSSTIHSFAQKAIQNVIDPDAGFHFYSMNISEKELNFLSLVFAKSVLVDYDMSAGKYKFIYEVDVEGSLIDDDLKTFFSYGLVTDPLIALFYASDFEGSKTTGVDSLAVGDAKHTLFDNVDDMLGEVLSGKIKFKLAIDNKSVVPEWDLAELTGLVDFSNTRATKPIVGNILFGQLIHTYNDLVSFYTTKFELNSSDYRYSIENLNGQLLSILGPVLKTRDVDHLLSSAISQIWHSGLIDSKRFAGSILTEERVKLELRIRLVLFVATKLWFIDDADGLKRLLETLSSTKAFERLVII